MTEFAEKAKTIGVSLRRGQSERKPVINEDDGTVGGYHTIRWDGSQDAEITAKPINAKAHPKGE